MTPARADQMLARHISIYVNLLMLTPSFRGLNKRTRDRYRYLVEDFCSRVAGERILLATHRKTALFVCRLRSRAYAERRIAMLSSLLKEAARADPHPTMDAQPVGLREWAEGKAKAKCNAQQRGAAIRNARRALKALAIGGRRAPYQSRFLAGNLVTSHRRNRQHDRMSRQ